jgi:hypothetical protein
LHPDGVESLSLLGESLGQRTFGWQVTGG